jgi:hypothetical protein
MGSLLDIDKAQLAHIEQSLATLRSLPDADREKKANLLRALENEKKELMRRNPAIHVAHPRKLPG